MRILGIGNALVDVMIQLKENSVLEKFHLPKGSMTLVDRDLSNVIHIETAGFPKKKSSGGSAANTIHGLAHLGIKSSFIGKVGNDEMGRFFKKDMQVSGIKTILFNSVSDTGKAIALITPDGERTFATHLGAAAELSPDDLSLDIFEGHSYFYIEGYLVQNTELIIKALRLAKLAGLKSCLDLASYNIVEKNRDLLLSALKDYVNIVFANEEEARALTGKNPEDSVQVLSELCDIAVVKKGPKGSLIKSGNSIVRIDALPSKIKDTTGAGDLFASGFIYGMSKSLDLDRSGFIGSLLASKVIEVIGAKMTESTWEMLRRQIMQIE